MPTDYLNPKLPSGLSQVTAPVIRATPEAMQGYGTIFSHIDEVEIEIVRWPASGWRPVDDDSGDEGGITEGVFVSSWDGDILYGFNAAVDGQYILGYAAEPSIAVRGHQRLPANLMLWHANYHPDGGQLFFPLDHQPYLVPLALPGDDVRPEDFRFFLFQGDEGCYIHPNIWHEGVFALSGRQRFIDRQGRVHARVSVNFATEFNCLLRADLQGIEGALLKSA